MKNLRVEIEAIIQKIGSPDASVLYITLHRLCEKTKSLTFSPKLDQQINNFATELTKLEETFDQIRNEKDFTKLDHVYRYVEHAIESGDNSSTLLEQLRLLETIHRESPALWDRIKKLRQAQTQITLSETNERKDIKTTVDMLQKNISSIKELIGV